MLLSTPASRACFNVMMCQVGCPCWKRNVSLLLSSDEQRVVSQALLVKHVSHLCSLQDGSSKLRPQRCLACLLHRVSDMPPASGWLWKRSFVL